MKHTVCAGALGQRESDSFEPVDTMYLHELPRTYGTGIRLLVRMLHAFAIQFVEEWHEDHRPLLIMEYAPGGNLAQQHSICRGMA